MKPRVDISNSNRFTIWEGGSWDPVRKLGTSIIVANSKGEKCQIIFDCNPTENQTHCAFFAEPGLVLASAYISVSTQSTGFLVHLELASVDSITTDLTQGTVKPRVELIPKWVRTGLAETLADVEKVADGYVGHEFYNAAFHNLLTLACRKAATLKKKQSFFWALPRQRATDRESA